MSTTQSGENTNGGSAEGATQGSRPELAQIRAEIERLRAENQALKTENCTLKSNKAEMQAELDCWVGSAEDPDIADALYRGNPNDMSEEDLEEMIQAQRERHARHDARYGRAAGATHEAWSQRAAAAAAEGYTYS